MKSVLKSTLITISALVILLATITVAEQLMQKKETLSVEANFDFVAWSNSISEEEAKAQLKDFLSSFNNWEEVESWLGAQGFRVEKPLLTPENTAEIYGIDNKPILFTAVAGWSPKRQGIIFANNLIIKIESKLFVYGVNIGFLYSEDPFLIQRINITKTRQ